MKPMIGWIVAALVLGLVFYVINRLWPEQGSFGFVVRIMAGILALICFLGFLLAALKFAGIPTPW
jgi:hypothetical protein